MTLNGGLVTPDTKSTERPQVCEEGNADLNWVGKPVREKGR